MLKLEIVQINYFTAIVSETEHDPRVPQRQQQYLRALKTIKNLKIVLGHFLTETITLQQANGAGSVSVMRSKEKRSDVNLTCQLLVDAYANSFEVAILISGDSDFMTPVHIVKEKLRKPIFLLNPQRDAQPTSAINKIATSLSQFGLALWSGANFLIKCLMREGTFQSRLNGGEIQNE